MIHVAFTYHQPCGCNIASQVRRVVGQPGGPGGEVGGAASAAGGGPPVADGGTDGALPASVGGPDRLLPVPDPENAGASCLALRSTTNPSACSYTCSDEYIAYCFSLCGHPTGTNYITWPLCRHRRRVRTRLQVAAFHWVLLHNTIGQLTRPSPRSRTCGLLHSRRATPRGRTRRHSRGTPGRCSRGFGRPTGRTRQRRRQGSLRGSKVGALGPMGTFASLFWRCSDELVAP
jgi:hypothetical protein